MTRTISAALKTALTSKEVRPLILCEALFDSGPLRLWNGMGQIQALGQTWIGTGTMLKVGPVEETSEVRATGVAISLSGIPSAIVAIALAENYQGRMARIYVGAFNLVTWAVIVDPIVMFQGPIDTMPISLEGDTTTIILSVESRLIRLEQASRRRYSAQDIRVEFPNDKGFDSVLAIQHIQIVWGRKSSE